MELTLYGKSDFPYLQDLLLKEKIRSLSEQSLSFKRSSHFEKGRNSRESLLKYSSLPLMRVTFSAFWLRHCIPIVKE